MLLILMELLFLNDQLQVMLRDKINRQLKLNDWLALVLGLTGMFFSVIAVSFPSPKSEEYYQPS